MSESLLTKYPFTIVAAKGIWRCIVSVGVDHIQELDFNNCTVPNVYEYGFLVNWNGIPMNLALCDWKTTFSDPFYTGVPTHSELVEFLYGPTRIPMWP